MFGVQLQESKTFQFITTVVLTVLIYYIYVRQYHPIPQVIQYTVDEDYEEYVPNTMVPYSKKYHPSCKGLFTKGTLIEPCSNTSKSKDCAKNVAEEWKPDGCRLKYYTKEDMITCLKTFSKTGQKTLHFMGDSRVRWVFETFRKKYSGQPVDWRTSKSVYIKEADVTIFFYDKSFINTFKRDLTNILKEKEKPILVYLANSLHHIHKFTGRDPFKTFAEFQKILTDLAPTLNRMSDVTKTVWPLQATVVKNGQPFLHRIPYRLQLVDLYNDFVNKILKPSNVTLSYSIRSLGKATISSYKDSAHIGFKADAIIVEILLNYICNNQWQQADVQDNDEDICCSKQDKFT